MLGVESWFKLEMYYKGVWTTTASKNEIANLEAALNTINVDLPKDIPLKADKGINQGKMWSCL